MNKDLIAQLEKRKADLKTAHDVAKTAYAELRGRLTANMEKQLEIKGAYDEIVRLLKEVA